MLFILPCYIKAECNNMDISRYKSLASNINSYYEFNEDLKNFNIIIYNVHNDLSLVVKGNNQSFYGNNEGFIYFNNLNPGQTVNFSIYPKSGDCSVYKLRTIYVNLPYYNNFFNDPICANSNSDLCLKWANTSMYNRDQFLNKITIDSSHEQPGGSLEPSNIENKYGFFDFLADYYILILLGIIVFGSYGIYVLNKKSKFDF